MNQTVYGWTRTLYPTNLRCAMARFLPWRGLPLMTSGKSERWAPRMLVITAILMSLGGLQSAQARFTQARDTVVAMYPTRRRPGLSYNGFIGALLHRGVNLLSRLCTHLRSQMPRVLGGYWLLEGRMVFAVDGTRVEVPRTKANEKAFGCAGRKKTGPQQYLTTLFHVVSGLPWGWRRGDGKSSERKHLLEMVDLLPRGAMLLADAGFTGYHLLGELNRRGISFVVRVGRNVRLLKKLGYAVREHDGIVYLWSEKIRQRNQPPMICRLVRVHGKRQDVYLLVSILNNSELSDRAVADLYRHRWQVEVYFRSLKRTLDRHKLRSECPKAAEVELDWAMLSLWLLGLMAAEQMIQAGQSSGDWSVAGALNVVRTAMQKLKLRCRKNYVCLALRLAKKDSYKRNGAKAIRKWPRKKYERPAGRPKMRMASKIEIKVAKRLRSMKHAA